MQQPSVEDEFEIALDGAHEWLWVGAGASGVSCHGVVGIVAVDLWRGQHKSAGHLQQHALLQSEEEHLASTHGHLS